MCAQTGSLFIHFTSLHLSHSLFDRWGTKDDRATTVLHSSLFSAFRRASPNFNPVDSVMLSSHLFFCLPLLLPPCTVPCRIIFASPVDLVLCPYHLSFHFFTVVRRSLFILSSKRGFREWSRNPCLTPQEKKPLYCKLRGGSNP